MTISFRESASTEIDPAAKVDVKTQRLQEHQPNRAQMSAAAMLPEELGPTVLR
jgi:hypothetical protein